MPEFLETILNLRETYPHAGLYGTGYTIKTPDGKTHINSYNSHLNTQEISNYFEVICRDMGGRWQLCLTSGMAIPKSIYNEVGGHPIGYKQSEDRCLRGKIALRHTIAYSPKIAAIYSYDVRTYNLRFSQYLSDPFADYIDSCNHDDLQKRADYQWIVEFADHGKIYCAEENLFHGHNRKRIRHSLHSIYSPSLQKKKRSLYLRSYLPHICLRCSQLIWRFIFSIYHKLRKIYSIITTT